MTAIAGDIEHPAAHAVAVCGRNQRAEERLEEVELHGIAPRCNRDRVAEITVPFTGVESRNPRPRLRIYISLGASVDEVLVPAPVPPIGIY